MSAAHTVLTSSSPSSRRAWIEISFVGFLPAPPTVAFLAEGVDRNSEAKENICDGIVAFLAEGVDRN